ncbi:MAG: SPFH domain-containing protein [Oscillospiraceae bacterium]|nr:SPFH domain-containing protein [Oscillospiraceae bacterium]
MGIIRAAANAISGSLAGQWLDYIVSGRMDHNILMTRGVRVVRTKNGNEYTPIHTITNGSRIMIAPNQLMILCDGGRVVDYCASEGYYEVYLAAAPSMFNGELSSAVRDTFQRMKYNGQPSGSQEVYFINLQEIKNLKFGTRNPLQYFDNFYQAELFVRCHGTYSIKITDPLKFFEEVVPRNASYVSTIVLSDQYLEEFLMALQSAVSIMSQDGVRISNLGARSVDIVNYLDRQLDPLWKEKRGIALVSVGIGNISYDEESRELIQIRSRNVMLNPEQHPYRNHSQNDSQDNSQNFSEHPAPSGSPVNLRKVWACQCGSKNYGNFCAVCGKAKPDSSRFWVCPCGLTNTGNFCTECGTKRP